MTLAVNRFPYSKMEVTKHPDGEDGRLFPRDHSNGVFTVWDFSEDSNLDIPFAGTNQANPASRSEWVVLLNDGDPDTKPMLVVRILNGLLKMNIDGGLDKIGIPWGSAVIIAKEDNASELVTAAFLHGGTNPGPEPEPSRGLKVNRLVGPGHYELLVGALNVFTSEVQTADLPLIGENEGEAKKGDVVYITYRPADKPNNAARPNKIWTLGSNRVASNGEWLAEILINAGSTMALYCDGENWAFLMGDSAEEEIPNMGSRYGYLPVRKADKGSGVMFAYPRSSNTVAKPVTGARMILPPIYPPEFAAAKGAFVAVPGDVVEVIFSPKLEAGGSPASVGTKFVVDTASGDYIVYGSNLYKEVEMRTSSSLMLRATSVGLWVAIISPGTSFLPMAVPPPPDVPEKEPEQEV